MVRSGVVVASAAVLMLAGCGGSPPSPAPTPSAVPLRAIDTCPATVVVPSESVATVPDAASPPTVTLAVGDEVTFPLPRGARVGLLDAPQPDVDATVCTPPGAETSTVDLVVLSEGYLRIGVQVGIQPVAKVLLKVTPP